MELNMDWNPSNREGFFAKKSWKKPKLNKIMEQVISPTITVSLTRSIRSVPNRRVKGILSYLVIIPQRQTSPTRGKTKLTA